MNTLSLEEMEQIEQLDAAWAAELQRNVKHVAGSLVGSFAFALPDMYELKEVQDLKDCEVRDTFSTFRDFFKSAVAVNSFPNELDTLSGVNVVPFDIFKASDKKYDTVSYVMQANGDALVLVYNM